MPQRMTFTKAAIAAIPLPPIGERTVCYDKKIPKLAVRVTHTGTRTFYVVKNVRGRMEWVRLGTSKDLTIEQARKAADKIIGQYADGKDPAKANREARAGLTFGEAFELS